MDKERVNEREEMNKRERESWGREREVGSGRVREGKVGNRGCIREGSYRESTEERRTRKDKE